jgi:excisionase family DNA binding protein
LTVVLDDAYRAGRQRGDVTVTAFRHELLTAREVAELMRVSTMTVYRLIKSGELPAIRVGKHLRIRRDDVEAYFDRRVVVADGGGQWPSA